MKNTFFTYDKRKIEMYPWLNKINHFFQMNDWLSATPNMMFKMFLDMINSNMCDYYLIKVKMIAEFTYNYRIDIEYEEIEAWVDIYMSIIDDELDLNKVYEA